MNRRLRSLFLAPLLVLAVALPAVAGEGQGYLPKGQNPGANGGGISAEQAAAIVRQAYDGRVVSVKPEGSSGETAYLVRVLLDGGRVKTVRVDSRGNVRDSN